MTMMGVIIVTSVAAMMISVSVMGSSSSSSSSSSSVVNAGALLDGLLQEYAYRAFVGPRTRTGVVYDGVVPSNLTGIRVSAMRLRSGSLRSKGVSMYKEFEIPKGVVEHPYVERLVLVYHDLGNWSMTYYPLPPGYTYIAPVLGLLAYDASNLTAAKDLPHLYIHASAQPISIHFSSHLLKRPVPKNIDKAKCVLFDLNGSLNLTDVLSDNICTTFQQGHFSIVVEKGENNNNNNNHHHSTKKKEVWIIVGSVVGGFALLVMLGVVVVWVRKYRQRKRMHQMERAADVGEALHMTTVGSTKAPAATGTRTQPTLETEYVP